MTQITLPRATLEQLVDALEKHDGNYKLSDKCADKIVAAITAGRAALANADRMMVDAGIEHPFFPKEPKHNLNDLLIGHDINNMFYKTKEAHDRAVARADRAARGLSE